MLWRRDGLLLFFLAWYLIALSVYLPLANHVSGYYATVPMVGLAMLGRMGNRGRMAERTGMTRVARRHRCLVLYRSRARGRDENSRAGFPYSRETSAIWSAVSRRLTGAIRIRSLSSQVSITIYSGSAYMTSQKWLSAGEASTSLAKQSRS